MLKTLHKLGLDSTEKVRVRDVEVAPRDVVAATLPDPMTLGDRMIGKTCAGTLVTGLGKDGTPAEDVPLPRRRQRVVDARVRLAGRRLADGAQPRRRARAARRAASGRAPACSGPEAFPAQPFLDKLAEFGSPHGVLELEPVERSRPRHDGL